MEYDEGALAVVIMIMPSLLIIIVFGPIMIKKYSLVHSVVMVQPNILGKVVERAEELLLLQTELSVGAVPSPPPPSPVSLFAICAVCRVKVLCELQNAHLSCRGLSCVVVGDVVDAG